MQHYLSSAPAWVTVSLIALFLYSVFYVSGTFRQAAIDAGLSAGQSQKVRYGIFGFYLLFLAYASALALNGVLDVNTLPPRNIVYTGFPLLVILFGIVGNTSIFKRLLKAISLEALIRLHIFRLLGAFFLILLAYQLLPARFALFAGLGDVITAIFAYPVARMVAQKQRGWKMALYAWNIFGMMDIIDLLLVAVLTGAGGNLREMAIFPFVWFPAFAPATILFLHTAIFRKLRQQQKA